MTDQDNLPREIEMKIERFNWARCAQRRNGLGSACSRAPLFQVSARTPPRRLWAVGCLRKFNL